MCSLSLPRIGRSYLLQFWSVVFVPYFLFSWSKKVPRHAWNFRTKYASIFAYKVPPSYVIILALTYSNFVFKYVVGCNDVYMYKNKFIYIYFFLCKFSLLFLSLYTFLSDSLRKKTILLEVVMGRVGSNHVCLLPPHLLFKMKNNPCKVWWVENILLILIKLMRYR